MRKHKSICSFKSDDAPCDCPPNTESDKSIDEVNTLLMCLEAKVWKDLGEIYPVTNQKRLTRKEVQELLHSLLMDVIGEDEFVPVSATGIDLGRITGVTQRNELRQIQRTELNKLFNKEETIK